MSLTIWQTLGNTFYQGDDSRSIRTNGAAGNSDLDLIAPMGFGGSGLGRSGFTPTPISAPPKPQPLNLRPKGSNSAGLGAANDISGPFGGLQGGLTNQAPLPRSLSPLPDLSRISPRNVGVDPIGKNLPSRRSAQPSQGIRDLAEKLQGGKSPSGSGKRPSTDGKGLPGTSKPETATAPKKLPFAEPEPAPKGRLGLSPSPSPANQPKTGTPSPKNSQPVQRRDPRTAKPFPGKPENQPLGDRPYSSGRPPTPQQFGPLAPLPVKTMRIPGYGNTYQVYIYVRGAITGEPNDPFLTQGGDVSVYAVVEYSDEVVTFYQIWKKYRNLSGQLIDEQTYRVAYYTGDPPDYGFDGWRVLSNDPTPQPLATPGTVAPPLRSPKKNKTPDFKPTPNGLPAPQPLPLPFPQPLPLPSPPPIEQPQQQPKRDKDKEPNAKPRPRPKAAPKPRPKPNPSPTPNNTGSGNFPTPDTTGTPVGSGEPGRDFKPNASPTPSKPSPTPDYPEPTPLNTPKTPSSDPRPSPSAIPIPDNTPDYSPIQDKEPTPTQKEPIPVVQFPPFPVAPKLGSGNACKTADPCTQKISDGVDSANDKATDIGKTVKDLTDKLDKALQGLDIVLLLKIDKKLGPEVEGGLSGQGKRIFDLVGRVQATASAIGEKLGKFAKWARLGQLVSILTLITTLHNALMLSRSVGETLLSMLSNGLAVFGIKDDQGNAYELGDLIGKTVENMMKETIGTENYTTLSTNFKKANRIYQAAANLGNSIQSLRFSVVSALETIGGWNARIGNALKRSGVVNESSYSWMNPSPNFDNKFTQALERVEDVVSQVDSVASEILSAQETVTQIGNQKTELLNSLGLGTEKPQTENQPQKTAAIASKAASAAPNIEATDLNKPGV